MFPGPFPQRSDRPGGLVADLHDPKFSVPFWPLRSAARRSAISNPSERGPAAGGSELVQLSAVIDPPKPWETRGLRPRRSGQCGSRRGRGSWRVAEEIADPYPKRAGRDPPCPCARVVVPELPAGKSAIPRLWTPPRFERHPLERLELTGWFAGRGRLREVELGDVCTAPLPDVRHSHGGDDPWPAAGGRHMDRGGSVAERGIGEPEAKGEQWLGPRGVVPAVSHVDPFGVLDLAPGARELAARRRGLDPWRRGRLWQAAEGSVIPNNTDASAAPSDAPGYQASITAETDESQGMSTGPPASTTTTVVPLTEATALINWSWSAGRASVARSAPSDS